jgi:hypothetical protein
MEFFPPFILVPSSEYVIMVKATNRKGEGVARYTTAATTKESGNDVG